MSESRSSSVIVIPLAFGQDFTDPGEGSSHGAFRATGVLGDLRDLRALQAEFEHSPAEAVEPREHVLQLVGKCRCILRARLVSVADELRFIDPVEEYLDIDRPTVCGLTPRLPE